MSCLRQISGEGGVNQTTLVVGGCRSGKSRYALELAERGFGARKVFMATCVPADGEMRCRVERHQAERGPSWTTVESPVRIAEDLLYHSNRADGIIVDCLTLWVSNLMLEDPDLDAVACRVRTLTDALRQTRCPVVLVSNEVGAGIVPENALARRFRDAAGFVNQQVARCADTVVWMVAGIPVTVKQPSGAGANP